MPLSAAGCSTGGAQHWMPMMCHYATLSAPHTCHGRHLPGMCTWHATPRGPQTHAMPGPALRLSQMAVAPVLPRSEAVHLYAHMMHIAS
jgi:hypothetical protein